MDYFRDDTDALVSRLSTVEGTKVPDANRTGSMRDSGVMNTYAWKGY